MKSIENNGLPGWKRTLDVAVILLALPFLLPLALFICVLIRLVSTGPILFQQERVGFRGSRFMCLKFRTMFCGAETVTHGTFAPIDGIRRPDDQDGCQG